MEQVELTSRAGSISKILRLNLEFLIIRIFALSIKILPFKGFIIDTAGLVYGLSLLPFRASLREMIINFKKISGYPGPIWLYVLRCFIRQGRDKAWTDAFFETGASVQEYFRSENMGILKEALKRGRGAVILGAHYGPEVSNFTLNKVVADFTALVAPEFEKSVQDPLTLVRGPLVSNKTRYYSKDGRILVSEKSEKELVRRLRGGGSIYINLDYFRNFPKGVVTDFFGLPVRVSYFPFKLALKYGAPVFFCFISRDEQGKFVVRLSPAAPFETPEEGVKLYCRALESKVMSYPFMWRKMKDLFAAIEGP